MSDEALTESNDDLPTKVRGWLSREGYPFELRVGRQLRQERYHSIEHGRYYRDPETEKWREIDIVAAAVAEPFVAKGEGQSRPPIIGVNLVIECKHGDRPWVIMASRASPGDSQFPSSYLNSRMTRAVLHQAEMPNLDPSGQHGSGLRLSTFGFGEYRGHNAVQTSRLGNTGKDADSVSSDSGQPNAAYAALRSVVAAASAVVKTSDASLTRVGEHVQPLTGASLILPVIVCKARLFRLTIEDDESDRLEEVDDIAVAAPPSGDLHGSINLVRILRSGAPLRGLARAAREDAETVAAVLRGNWPEYSQRALRSLGLIATQDSARRTP